MPNWYFSPFQNHGLVKGHNLRLNPTHGIASYLVLLSVDITEREERREERREKEGRRRERKRKEKS